MNATDAIRAQARVAGGAPAIIKADHSVVSYAEFDRLIDAAAQALGPLSLVPGQIVGLSMGGPDEFPGIVVSLALARRGIASADPGLPGERMALCFTDPGRTAPAGVRTMSLDQFWSTLAPPASDIAAHADPAAVLRIMASSGTTGLPKFAAISHHGMAQRVATYDSRMGGHGKVRIIAGGFGGSWGFRNLLAAFGAGACVVLSNPTDAAQAIRRHNVTGLSIAPVSLQKIVTNLADNATPPPALRLISVSGSTLSMPLRALVRQRLCANLMARCGSMETGQIAASPMRDESGFTAQLQEGVQAEAVGADGKPLPPGTQGLLRYRAPRMIHAYEGAPVLSATTFRDGWYHSGDIGTVSPEGWLTLTGRDRDMINHGGVKVAPSVIEDVLLSMPGITEAAAFGVEDRQGMEQIWAAIVATRAVPKAELAVRCQASLGERAPKYIVQIASLPRNEAGKILRAPLIESARQIQL